MYFRQVISVHSSLLEKLSLEKSILQNIRLSLIIFILPVSDVLII